MHAIWHEEWLQSCKKIIESFGQPTSLIACGRASATLPKVMTNLLQCGCSSSVPASGCLVRYYWVLPFFFAVLLAGAHAFHIAIAE